MILVSLVACAVISTKSVLRNGAVVLIDVVPQKLASVSLIAGNKGAPETNDTHGWSHLLEHLVAKGIDGGADKRLEAQGMYLTAETTRDGMIFTVFCKPTQLKPALAEIKNLLVEPPISQVQIDRETVILQEELALMDEPGELASACWKLAYGDQGLNPHGDLTTIAKATPERLQDLFKRRFAPENLALSLSGFPPESLGEASQVVADLKRATPGASVKRPEGKSGRIETSRARGEARAATVGAFDDPKTAWCLAAALSVGSKIQGAFVAYTPTIQNGLVIIGRADQTSGIGTAIDGMGDSDLVYLYHRAKLWASQWAEGKMTALTEGILATQNPDADLNALKQNAVKMTFDQFRIGLSRFHKDSAVIAVGVR